MIIIFNPAAGRRRVAALWRVLDVLTANGVRLDVVATQRRGHATELARAACVAGERMVVAAGGDGTIAEVAQGINGYGTPLGIIPIGTANVFAHEIGLSFAPRDVAAALALMRTKAIRPGFLQSPAGDRLFVQMVGAGFDADVVQALPPRLKRVFGKTAYVMQGFAELVRYRFPRINLQLDGVPMQTGGVIVSKGRFYAGRHLLAREADPAMPGFHVALFDRNGPAATLVYGAMLPTGMLGRIPTVRLIKAERVDILGDQRIPVQADGDAVGHTPISIRTASQPLHVVTG
jgi:YegS/Rv2252/BmrU family lipid kinase